MNDKPTRRKLSTRGFTSLLLMLSFLVMGVSGVVLYLTPKGRVANWTDWTILGLGKEDWAAVHINNSILFLIVSVVHLVLNWKLFWGYIKKRTAAGLNLKWELSAASLVGLLVVAGTLWGIPPFSSIIDLNDRVKVYWADRAPHAPVPHSEELSLEQFAGHISLSVEDAADALRKEGFDVEDTGLSLKELASQKGAPPSEIMAAIKKHFPTAGGAGGRGPGQARGQGRGMGRGQGFGQGLGQGRGQRGEGPAQGPPAAGAADQ